MFEVGSTGKVGTIVVYIYVMSVEQDFIWLVERSWICRDIVGSNKIIYGC